jgi:hypothetical protein
MEPVPKNVMNFSKQDAVFLSTGRGAKNFSVLCGYPNGAIHFMSAYFLTANKDGGGRNLLKISMTYLFNKDLDNIFSQTHFSFFLAGQSLLYLRLKRSIGSTRSPHADSDIR